MSDETAKWASPRGHAIASHETDRLPAVSGMGVTVDSADDARQMALEYMTDPMFPIYMQHGSKEFALIPAEFVDAIISALTTPAMSTHDGWRTDTDNAPRNGTRIIVSDGVAVDSDGNETDLEDAVASYLTDYSCYMLCTFSPNQSFDVKSFKKWKYLEQPLTQPAPVEKE